MKTATTVSAARRTVLRHPRSVALYDCGSGYRDHWRPRALAELENALGPDGAWPGDLQHIGVPYHHGARRASSGCLRYDPLGDCRLSCALGICGAVPES